MNNIVTKPALDSHNKVVKVIDKRYLSDSVVLLTFENPGFNFASGQHVILSFLDTIYDREYSICSSEDDEHLSVLIKIVNEGYFTSRIAEIQIGDELNLRGPHGNFCLDLLANSTKKHYLIATGSGIAPFLSFQKTYGQLINFEVIHGTRTVDGTVFRNVFPNYKVCLSREVVESNDLLYFAGRVTDYIRSIQFDNDGLFYLCGNFDMIYDVETYLVQIGVNPNCIFKEVYF
jgi:ferredoxin-NADP reductase